MPISPKEIMKKQKKLFKENSKVLCNYIDEKLTNLGFVIPLGEIYKLMRKEAKTPSALQDAQIAYVINIYRGVGWGVKAYPEIRSYDGERLGSLVFDVPLVDFKEIFDPSKDCTPDSSPIIEDVEGEPPIYLPNRLEGIRTKGGFIWKAAEGAVDKEIIQDLEEEESI